MRFSSSTVAVYCALAAIATIDNVNAWIVQHPISNKNKLTIEPIITTTTTTTSIISQQQNRDLTRRKKQQLFINDKKKVETALQGKLDDDDEDEDDDDDDDDDDDYEYAIDASSPLAKGVDSVSWLPSVVGKVGSLDNVALTQGDSEILPLFPLGGIVYTPNSEHILNIFEPRYREMYSDILLNGTKRFAVSMSHPTEVGRFASMAVLFELQDLKEVSEQTGDRIKYICNHKVTGRVKLHRVVNPQAWESRTTYLRVEGTLIDDSGKNRQQQQSTTTTTTTTTTDEPKKDEEIPPNKFEAMKMAFTNAFTKGGIGSSSGTSGNDDSKDNNDGQKMKMTTTTSGGGDGSNIVEERLLRTKFAELVEIQHELEEDVRFTRASVISLSTKAGSGDDGLWQTIKLWQSFADQRLMARQNELQRDFQTKLQEFLKKDKGIKDDELPSAIRFQDLSPALQKDVTELQKRMTMELQPLVLESTLTMQKLLEARDHTERLKLVRYFITSEIKRLRTKRTIQVMFSNKSTTTPPTTGTESPSTTNTTSSSSSSSTTASTISSSSSSSASIPPEEQILDDKAILKQLKENLKETSSTTQTSFFSDEDAFQ